LKKEFNTLLQKAFDNSKDPSKVDEHQWVPRYKVPVKEIVINDNTPKGQGVKLEYLQALYKKYSKLKEGFTLHP